MQTEQQKVLWIIFSVALFILVVVGVGVIWFLPASPGKGTQTAKVQSGSQAKISFDPYEWAKSQNNNYPGLETPPAAQPSTGQPGSQGNSNFTIIYGQQPGQSQSTPAASPPSQPKTAAPPAPRPAPAPAPAPVPRQKVSAPAPQRVAPPVRAPRVTAVAPPPRTVEHWIQVASFTSDFRAERAKQLLDKNGISGRVMTHEIRGRTFFRVRVGPYPTQQEAEKFLGQIKKISEFHNSYISLEYSAESAN